MGYVIHRGGKEECEKIAEQINRDLPDFYKDSRLFAGRPVASVGAYHVEGVPYFVAAEIDSKEIICGYLGTHGFSHIYDHGQGYGAQPVQTRALKACEARYRRWAEKHIVPTDAEILATEPKGADDEDEED